MLGAHATSISNCGGPKDIFQVSKLTLAPDPVARREPFTITAIGKLSKAFSGGTVSHDLDLKVSAFGKTIAQEWKNSTLLGLDPVVPAGAVKLIVGPTELPLIPGSIALSGRYTIVDEDGAAVACVALDVQTPLAAFAEVAQPDERHEQAEPSEPASCREPGDHLRNVSVARSEDGWTQTTYTFDEAITTLTAEASLKVYMGSLPLTIKMNVPVLYEPGIPKGDVKVRTKPAPSSQAVPAIGALSDPPAAHVVGNIVVVDGKREEITCVHVDNQPPEFPTHEQTVVV